MGNDADVREDEKYPYVPTESSFVVLRLRAYIGSRFAECVVGALRKNRHVERVPCGWAVDDQCVEGEFVPRLSETPRVIRGEFLLSTGHNRKHTYIYTYILANVTNKHPFSQLLARALRFRAILDPEGYLEPHEARP